MQMCMAKKITNRYLSNLSLVFMEVTLNRSALDVKLKIFIYYLSPQLGSLQLKIYLSSGLLNIFLFTLR